jgi:hypothetical protein
MGGGRKHLHFYCFGLFFFFFAVLGFKLRTPCLLRQALEPLYQSNTLF